MQNDELLARKFLIFSFSGDSFGRPQTNKNNESHRANTISDPSDPLRVRGGRVQLRHGRYDGRRGGSALQRGGCSDTLDALATQSE